MEKTNETFQILKYFSTFALKMAGLYIHIPFCKSRCIYCGFYSTTGLEQRQRYVDAVVKEARQRQVEGTIGTVYFGGGTPSQLTAVQLRQLFDAIYYIYKVEDDAEVTIECNPDDVTEAFADLMAQLPVNRISMGAQTFDDQRLQFLRRRHTVAQVSVAVERLRKAGISNISIDLMYGFPNETLADWLHDIDSALALKPEHLSAYCLMVEEGTPLHRMNIEPADEETERDMYYTLIDRLAVNGYEHYEISNFARPAFRSRHNGNYWADVPYVGLGAAAHSYDGRCRQWNPDDLSLYIKGIEDGNLVVEQDWLDDDSRYNDRVMLSLRTCEGIDLAQLTPDNRAYLLAQSQRHQDEGLMVRYGDRLRLSREGLFVSDMVMSDLMRV